MARLNIIVFIQYWYISYIYWNMCENFVGSFVVAGFEHYCFPFKDSKVNRKVEAPWTDLRLISGEDWDIAKIVLWYVFIEELDLLHTCKIKSLPNAFGNLRNLEHIKLSKAYNLESLPNYFGNLVRLKYLKLSGASKIKSLQDSFGNLSILEHIDLFSVARIWSSLQIPLRTFNPA